MIIKQIQRMGKSEHEIVNEQLSLYLDGQLAAEERARTQKHLQQCEACRQELRSLRWTKNLLQETPAIRLPRSFVIREADVPARRPAGRRTPVFAMQWATAIVATLLVLVLAGDMLAGAWAPRRAAQTAMFKTGEREAEVSIPAQAERADAAEATPGAPAGEQDTRMVYQGTPEPAPEEAQPLLAAEKRQNDGEETPAATETPAPTEEARVATEQERVATEPPVVALEKQVVPGLGGGGTSAQETPPPPALGPEYGTTPPAELAERGGRPAALLATSSSTWRWVELGLAITLLGLVVTMIWMRRRV